jgi:hypothetical protein
MNLFIYVEGQEEELFVTRKAVRRGWCLGGEEFRRELLEQMEGRMGRHHGGVERQETAEQRAASSWRRS